MNEKMPHTITKDIQNILNQNSDVAKIWETLTPLAQNEWICWVTYFKKEETHAEHLVRLKEDLLKGKRRPCCWSGCPHRPGHPKKVYTAKKK
ncbi:MAG: YdeI/OmpD-associated family protein [Ginsengibacter sp.]